VEGGENDVSPFPSPSKNNQTWSIPKATKLGTFHWSLSKMLPHWPLSIGFISKATKLGPSICHQVGVFLHLLLFHFF
jgi:hypothetical protein